MSNESEDKKVIKSDDISVIFLSTHNYKDYQEQLENFKSKNERINKVVHARPSIIDGKIDEYDNRDTVLLFFVNIDGKDKLIGYVSFAASSLKDTDLEISIPSVVVNTFAISEQFSKKYYAVLVPYLDDNGREIGVSELSCASFMLEYLMDSLDDISTSIGITHVYLYAEPAKGVPEFYKDNDFFPFTSDIKAFNLVNREYCFIRTLNNARHRKFGLDAEQHHNN
ncbi:hypothetical protein [Ruminococcus champanellensis]|uniref:hypothetical protein n=1 Tax=Ruminococcus champanellensis TaxID=1161942 RepID=UPI00248BBB22|nr:hypothetical protein [Ruminococcus champanellensis]